MKHTILKHHQVKIEWTRQLVAQQKKKTQQIHKETILQNEVMDAERRKQVGSIANQQRLQAKETDRNVAQINNTINTEMENTLTDIQRWVEIFCDYYLKYFPKQRFAVRGSYVAEKKEIGHGTAGNSSLRL